MYLTMFAVMLAAVVGYTDCHLSNSEQTTKQISIELINQKPSHGINALLLPCIEPYDARFCLNGGRCFNVTVASYSIPSCECATGFMGERCEQKYLNRSYNPENYMQVDDIITSQNESKVDGHLSNSEQSSKQMSIESINPKPSHGVNALLIPCIEPYDANFCLNGGLCFNVTVASYSILSCECVIGFMGERCEQKYLHPFNDHENYMQADDIFTSQNESKVDKSRTIKNSNDVFVSEIYVKPSAGNKVSITINLVLAVLLLHTLIFIVAL